MAEPIAARAVWFSGARAAELREEVAPPPGPGEVRVRAVASAVSHGTELLVYRGQVPAELPLDLPTLAGGYGFPVKFGYGAAGRVVDVGPGVAGLGPGDAVFCLHPHQSVFTLPAALVQPLPAGLDVGLGVFCANLETAVNIAHDAHPRLGERVALFGLGTVGLLTLQTLRLAGAEVLAVDPLPARRELALALGAAAALASGPGLAAAVWEACGGRGADLAVEVSGAPAALQQAIGCVAAEGTVVVASWYGAKAVGLDLGGHFHRGRVRLRSSQVGRLAPEGWPRWDHARRWETVRALLPRLALRELVGETAPLAAAPEVYARLDRGEAAGQVVFRYDEEGA